MIPGIDLSSHNPFATVPWHEAKFCFIRVTMGAEGLDPLAIKHVQNAMDRQIGMIGAYHYLRADSPGEAQAKHFLNRVRDIESGSVQLGLAVDVEDLPDPRPKWDRVKYLDCLLQFLAHVADEGRVCAVYISPNMAQQLALPAALSAFPLWLAQWTPVPKAPPPWGDWQVWQYGANHGVDQNRFRGSIRELRALMGLDKESHSYLGSVVTAIRGAMGLDLEDTLDGVSNG